MEKKKYHCYCDSLQLICQVHRNDPIANTINPKAVEAYWDRRDGVYNKDNEEYDRIMGKSIRRHKLLKIKSILIKYVRCIISWDFSHLRLKETFFGDKYMNTWENRWFWIKLFNGLIEFKFHLNNCTYNKPWYHGIIIRFRVSICGVFKPHLVLCIGPDANSY